MESLKHSIILTFILSYKTKQQLDVDDDYDDNNDDDDEALVTSGNRERYLATRSLKYESFNFLTWRLKKYSFSLPGYGYFVLHLGGLVCPKHFF